MIYLKILRGVCHSVPVFVIKIAMFHKDIPNPTADPGSIRISRFWTTQLVTSMWESCLVRVRGHSLAKLVEKWLNYAEYPLVN